MLHPQAKAFIDLLIEKGVPPTHTLPYTDARRFYRERRALAQPEPGEVALVQDLSAEGLHGAIPLRYYRPLGSDASAVLPVLVYYHGGGWTIGDLDTHDTLCRELCNLSGCAVVAVDYRMGPEHRFPAAVDDVLAATRWVRQQAASLKVDANRLAVGGDSAGGNLAAVVSIAAREAGNLPIAFQLLIYPATDMRRGHPSHTTNGQGYVLTSDSITYFHDHYIDDAKHDLDWRASPLLHENLKGLPPALVITAGYDPLRDEGLDYARALTEAGNRASYVCFERQIHGFITMGRILDEANVAVGLCAAELRRALKP
ncbi:alpha/beta hydrolase [Variovorax sp. Sphag1AA]|uniref:alpha/beta hydrolase n=1 Tax=Variovorax sp. Sphag1AA TaxID=2587027 RepID=UPI00161518EE|nr:alpha/beta hydrolase [Variovorax sp. Sphag1AA]MBB3179899.1 acetyl esterase [Variovorax sp. Sphag1AA]